MQDFRSTAARREQTPGQETTAINRVRSELARGKYDGIANCVGLSRDVALGILGLAAGVQLHVGQIVIKVRGNVLLKMRRSRSARCRDHQVHATRRRNGDPCRGRRRVLNLRGGKMILSRRRSRYRVVRHPVDLAPKWIVSRTDPEDALTSRTSTSARATSRSACQRANEVAGKPCGTLVFCFIEPGVTRKLA